MKLHAFLRSAALFGVVALGTSAFSASGPPLSPEIQDVAVIQKKGRLLVFATLEGAFSRKIFDALHSGVTTRVTYEISLMRLRRLLFDASVASRKLVHQVKYNALKKAYSFKSKRDSGERVRKVTVDQEEMIDWMVEINGLDIATTKQLLPNGKYYIRIRARMNSVDIVFPFNYLFAFLERQTSWSISAPFGVKGM